MGKVLVAFEYSGIVRDAFLKKGHNAISCDIIDTESPGPHIKNDINNVSFSGYDMIIMHIPCTYLCVSGNRWYGSQSERYYLRLQAAKWTQYTWDRAVKECDKVVLENPVGVINTLTNLPKPQYIQPYQFGHPETKKTGLWKTNAVPDLIPTNIVKPEYIIGKDGKRYSRIHYMSQWKAKERGKLRSKTYLGVGKAFAEQWGKMI